MGLNGSYGMGVVLTAKNLASGELNKFSDSVTRAHGAAAGASKDLSKSFGDLGRGAAVMSVGVAGLSALYPASEAATAFGYEIAKIRTVIDEASFSTERLRSTTMGLAGTYGLDAMAQAGALYEVLGAGITDATKATDMMHVANQFAVGGSTSLMGAVDVLTSAVNTYADQGLTAARASDLMFTAIAAGKTTAEQLSQSLGEIAPTAHAAGVGFDELQAAIAALTVQGIKTPQAVTSLNAVISNIMKPTSEAEKEAKRLGIQFDATALKTMGLKGVLDQLVNSSKLTDDTYTQLFGSIEGVKGALTLTSNGGAKFTDVLAQMAKAGGATATAFAVIANTTKFQGDRFMSLSKNALISIGEVLEPIKARLLSFANDLIERFNNLNPAVRGFIVQAFAVVSAVLAVLGAVMAAKAGVAILAASLAAAGTSLGALALSAGAALLIVGAVAVAVYGLKVAVDRNLGGVGDTFTSAVHKLSLAYDALVQLFTQGGFSGAVRDEMGKAENGGVRAFAIKVFLWVERIRNFFGGVADGFSAAMDAAKPAFAGFSLALDGIASAFGVVADTPKQAGAAFDAFGSTGATVGKALGKGLELVVSALTTIMKIVTGVKSMFTFDDVSSGAVGAFSAIKDALSDVWDTITGITGSVATGSDTWRALGKVLGFVVVGGLRAVQNTIQTVGVFFANVLTGMAGVVNVVGGILTGNWSRVWLGMKQIVFGVISSIVDGFLGFVQTIASALDQLSVLGGNKSTYAADVSKYRTEVREGMRDSFGLNAPLAPPPVANTAPGGLGAAATATSNAALSTLASGLPQSTATVDPAAVAAMQASADATLALAKRPVVVQVDGRDLASSVDSSNTSDAARSFSSEATAEG